MGTSEETAAAFDALIACYERTIGELLAVRDSVLASRDELRSRLGNTQHPRVLQALHQATLGAERAEGAARTLTAAITSVRRHAGVLGLTLAIPDRPGGSGRTIPSAEPRQSRLSPRTFDREAILRALAPFDVGGVRRTHGHAVDERGLTYGLHSGDKRRDRALIDATCKRLSQRGLLPEGATSARASDVEQKFATRMRLEGIREANLVINNPNGPCRPRLGCVWTIPHLLDPGQRLAVRWRDAAGRWH